MRKKSEQRATLMQLLKEDRREYANELARNVPPEFKTSYYRDHAFGAVSAALRFGIITIDEFNALWNWITEIWMRKVTQ